MSKSDASHHPPASSRRDATRHGEAPSVDSPGLTEERELAECVRRGDGELEGILSALMPRLLTSLEQRGCGPIEAATLGPPIREGLRESLLEHCPSGQPGDGLAPRVLVRVRERVSAFMDREEPERNGAAFNGIAWAREHITPDLFGDCLQGQELLRAWPALRRRADAVRRLVEGHLRLASTLARCYMGRGLDLDDLRQIAAVSLEKAAQAFDARLGVPFKGFASTIIRNDLAGALRTARGGSVHGARQRRPLQQRRTPPRAGTRSAPDTRRGLREPWLGGDTAKERRTRPPHRPPSEPRSLRGGDRRDAPRCSRLRAGRGSRTS